jgi:Tfp pilus assembly protein FimT
MLPLPVRKFSKHNMGFTVLEVGITVLVIGIMTAVTVPSLVGWYSNSQVEDALDRLEGALKEAQREAIRKNTDCTVTIPTGANQTLASSAAGSAQDVMIELSSF